MYLVDRQIKRRVASLKFDVPDGFDSFDVDAQVQPCSVDLRLGVKFWVQRSRSELDLRRSKLLDVNPRKHWKEHVIFPGQHIKLRPGQLMLAQTLEYFEVPADCAGKIEGRSSFGRLGLSVHCTADFINPGYSGRMALQLTNFSKTTMRLYPGMPICQLALIELKEVPERSYGAPDLQSKYSNDDGGPSYWWRDRLVRRLLDKLRESDYSLAVQSELIKILGGVELEVIDRLEVFVAHRRSIALDNVDSLLDEFARAEDRARLVHTVQTRGAIGAFLVLLAAAISVFFVFPYSVGHWLLWGVTALAAVGAIWAISRKEASWLTTTRLELLRGRMR